MTLNEFLFTRRCTISSVDVSDAVLDLDDDEKEEVNEGEGNYNYLQQFGDNDDDVYEDGDQWGTLVTAADESKGIFKDIVEAVSRHAPKLCHDFAITAQVCSVHPDIMHYVQDCMRADKSHLRAAVEQCVQNLYAHDVDGQEDGDWTERLTYYGMS